MPVPDVAPVATSLLRARCALRRWRPPFPRRWLPLPTMPRLLPEPLRVRVLPLRSLLAEPPLDAVPHFPRLADSRSRSLIPQSIPARPGRGLTLQPRAFLLRAPRRERLLLILLRRRRDRLLPLQFPALRYCRRESVCSPGDLPRALFREKWTGGLRTFLSVARRLPEPRLKLSPEVLRKLQPAPRAHAAHEVAPSRQTSARHRESFPQLKPEPDVPAREPPREELPLEAGGDISRSTRPEES